MTDAVTSSPEASAGEAAIAAYGRVAAALGAPGAAFATDQVMIGGQVQRVYAGIAPDVGQLLRKAEQQVGDAPFLIEEGRETSYGALFRASARLASVLADKGLGKGDHIGILMRNRAEWLIAFVATMRLGAVAVLFNSRSVGEELQSAVAQVPCTILLADAERAEQLGRIGSVTPILNPAEQHHGGGGDAAFGWSDLHDPDAPAAILFTSGTSGGARAAVLSHRNLVNMERNVAYIAALTTGVEAELLGMTPDALAVLSPPAVNLLLFPFFHISGLTAFFRTLAAGGRMLLMRRWDAVEALALIEGHGVTMLSGPPMVLSDLLDQAPAPERLATINALVIGGQGILPSLIDRTARVMPRAGFSIGWGMTEVSGAVTAAVGSLYRARPASAGVMLPLTDIRTCDEDGAVLPAGRTGELLVGGALVMQGYFGDPQASAAVLTDGWLRSGDVGWVDADGFVTLVDRKKDIVICSGENVYCGEVERVLGAHPAVAEAAVFGIPDTRTGERVVAAVTLRAGATCSAAELIAAARANLSAYRVPSEIVFDLPMAHNATGKVGKAQLRAAMLARYDGGRA